MALDSTIRSPVAPPPPSKCACSASGRLKMCRGGELMCVDMLLVDSQSTMMPATVNVSRLVTHQPNLEADSVLLILFNDSTSFKKITEPAVPIPLESFRFRNYSEMLGLANSKNQLPDLIGEITAVKSTPTLLRTSL